MAAKKGSTPQGSENAERVIYTATANEAPKDVAQDAPKPFAVRARTAASRPANAGRKPWDLPGLLDAVKALGAEEEIYLEHKASILRAWVKRHFPKDAPVRVVKDASGQGVTIVRKRGA